MSPTPRVDAEQIARLALGRPDDWLPARRRLRLPRVGMHWLGPLVVAGTTLFGWRAFSGQAGQVALGLWLGSAAIVLMAWSFLLALRPKLLESLFGGLDRMYRVHRWAGMLAMVAMVLHTQSPTRVRGGVLGASRVVANNARDLASVGEWLLIGLVGISLVRWVPYRYWRWTHKLLGVPFAFACFHFFTARKPYANGDPWGWWFGVIMAIGIGAWVLRVVGRDMVLPGVRHRITAVERVGATTELRLRPVRRRLGHRVGQFAVVKIQRPGLREPHVFTIASSPKAEELRFFIRDLGDWTARVHRADLLGAEVRVEGPYGHFRPLPRRRRPTVWIAGGVGITPFLAAVDHLTPAPVEDRPKLIYCVRTRADATGIRALEQADADGRIRLKVFASSEGRRFSPDQLPLLVQNLRSAHVAVCGPAGLVADTADAARAAGARRVVTEAFDLRGGMGPDLSVVVEELLGRPVPGRARVFAVDDDEPRSSRAVEMTG